MVPRRDQYPELDALRCSGRPPGPMSWDLKNPREESRGRGGLPCAKYEWFSGNSSTGSEYETFNN